MAKTTGAQSFVETLQHYGIKYVFGNPGSSIASILDSIIGHPDVNFLLGVQEASVIGMADGYSRATGTPGVALVHTTPGLSNSLGGIYNAYASGIPLVVIAGNQDSKILGRTAFCESPDITAIPRQFVKLSQEIPRADRISEILARALRVAMARPTGPCFLSLARDLQTEEVEMELGEKQKDPFSTFLFRPEAAKVLEAAELLAQAVRPVLIAGYDIAKDSAYQEVVQLAELLGCPVFGEEITNSGGLNFPTDHPQYLGYFEPGLEVIEKADVIMVVGKKLFAEFAYSGKPRLPRAAKIIHLHESPWEIGKLHAPRVSLQGDTKSGARDIYQALQELVHKNWAAEWAERLAERKEEVRLYRAGRKQKLERQAAENWNAVPIKLPRLAKEIAALMGPGVTVVNEATRSTAALFSYVDFHDPRSLYSCPGGYLGWGLPAALGIKLAFPERKVLAYLGDGTTLYTIQALWSAVKYHLPVVAVICNNASYLAVKAHLNILGGNAAQTGNFEGAELTPRVNFAQVAEGFGARGYTVTEPDQIGPALKEAFAKDEVTVIDVLLDASIPAPTR